MPLYPFPLWTGSPSIKIFLFLGAFATCVLGSPMQPQPAKADVSDYTLAEGDVLEFDILDDADPPRQVVVSNDGRVQIPLLGPVKVSNMTLAEARNELRQSFIKRELLNDPQIGLSVVNYRPIFVLGDVKSPRSFPFQ